MIIRHKEIKPDENEPFKECKLGREKYGRVLTSIVGSYAEGFVLAIDNKWGTGKTTFLRMWQKSLEKENFRTCYFNVWENDFNKDPLVAIMAELHSIKGGKIGKNSSLFKKGAILAKAAAPSILKTLAKRVVDIDEVATAVEKTAEGATDILKEEIDDYAKRKKGLNEFRIALAKYVQSAGNDKPLIFIIDELDRCRPDYAVEVLEYVKHFFNVSGIVFVLAIDKAQLLYAVQGFYGSASIDSVEYLRRFIDLEYSLPDPSIIEYSRYLYDYFKFDDFFRSQGRVNHRELVQERHTLIDFAEKLFEKHNLSLRQQEKIFAHTRVALRCFLSDNYIIPIPFLFLVYVRLVDINFFGQIKRFELTIQEFIDRMFSHFPRNLDANLFGALERMEALLVNLYFNSYRETHYLEKLFVREENDKTDKLLVKSGFGTVEATNNLARFLQSRSWNYSDAGIKYLLTKIDLADQLVGL